MRVYGEAVHFNNDIIFGCFNGKLYRLNHSNGYVEEIFQVKGSKQNYYTVYNDKDEFIDGFELYGEDMNSSERKILGLGAILSTPVIDHEIIYFGDSNGMIYAIKLK